MQIFPFTLSIIKRALNKSASQEKIKSNHCSVITVSSSINILLNAIKPLGGKEEHSDSDRLGMLIKMTLHSLQVQNYSESGKEVTA